MSINGVLEDLPLADVLQFIHLGQRSGTLYLWRNDADRAEVSFHNGRIVGAWTPGQPRLGDRLVAEQLVTSDDLQACLDAQRRDGASQSLGQILLDRELVRREDIHRLLRAQIEDTVFRLVTWRHGQFHFEIDDLSRLDDFAVDTQELLDLDLNTQMLLLEATRIFDERLRGGGSEDDRPSQQVDLERHLARAGLAGRPPGESSVGETQPMPAIPEDEAVPPNAAYPAPGPVRCQVVTEDADLVRELRAALSSSTARLVNVRLREAGTRVPGEAGAPVVLLDLRGGDLDARSVATLARTRPAAPVVVVAGSDVETESLYDSGAVAVVQPPVSRIVPSCRNLIRVLGHGLSQRPEGWGARGYDRFRQVVSNVHAGLHSATMALNLMSAISESVERAVLFLRRGEDLVAMGAFGASADGRPLAETTSGMELRPEPGCSLRRAFDEGELQTSSFHDALLPPTFASLLGAPVSRQVVIFPVLGAERTISVVYTDNGAREDPIEDVKILELITAQVGVAFENELLIHRIGGRGLDAAIDEVWRDEA